MQTWVEPAPPRSSAVTSSADSSASLFDNDETPEGGTADTDDDDVDSDDPFHFSVASLPEISFARGSTFPSLQADSRSTSKEFEESDSDSVSSDAEGSSVVTRHAAPKHPPVSPEEILYIQMVSRPPHIPLAAHIFEGIRRKANPERSKYPKNLRPLLARASNLVKGDRRSTPGRTCLGSV